MEASTTAPHCEATWQCCRLPTPRAEMARTAAASIPEEVCVQEDSEEGLAPEPPRGRRRIWIILVVLACLGAGAWIAHGRTKGPQQAKSPGGGTAGPPARRPRRCHHQGSWPAG